LIDSARAKLWDVVNELATAKPTPLLRVGLLTYGSPKLSTADQGWVVRQIDLTTDLDTVYARMMAMTTSGGDEYVGWVLNDALHTMSWSADASALKLIFVAGNESADQASHQYNFRHVAELARGEGIVINAFYAGDPQRGIAEAWDQVAQQGGGHFAAIDMHKGTIQVATPQDKVLRELNEQLNATYVPYGRRGDEGAANQEAQDHNAAGLGVQSVASRVAAKATALYHNAAWDLVDAAASADFDLAEVKEEDLPENMRSMAAPERRAHVEEQRQARAAIQKKIRQVNAEREGYLKAKRAQRGGGKTSLDDAMRQAIRQQGADKGLTFEESASQGAAGQADQPEAGTPSSAE
jgi:hypothetical protein